MEALDLNDVGLWATLFQSGWELDWAIAEQQTLKVVPFFLPNSIIGHDFDGIVRQLDRILPDSITVPHPTPPGYCIVCNASDYRVDPADLREFVRNVSRLRPGLEVTLIDHSHRIYALATAHVRDVLPLQFQRISDLYVVRIA